MFPEKNINYSLKTNKKSKKLSYFGKKIFFFYKKVKKNSKNLLSKT